MREFCDWGCVHCPCGTDDQKTRRPKHRFHNSLAHSGVGWHGLWGLALVHPSPSASQEIQSGPDSGPFCKPLFISPNHRPPKTTSPVGHAPSDNALVSLAISFSAPSRSNSSARSFGRSTCYDIAAFRFGPVCVPPKGISVHRTVQVGGHPKNGSAAVATGLAPGRPKREVAGVIGCVL